MRWNWNQSDWLEFRWDSAALAAAEAAFLRGAGVLVGSAKHLDDDVRKQVLVDAMSIEALATSEIEGEMLNRASVQSSTHLRYQSGGNDKEIYWIVDTKSGRPTPWALDLKKPMASVTRDYAIVARIHAEDTGQPQIIVAGIGMSGTAAAGELLTSAAQMDALRKSVEKGFYHSDFEAVISTDVVDGIAGPPKILTVAIQ